MKLPPPAFAHPLLRQIVRRYYKENYGMVYEGSPEPEWLLFSCPNRGTDNLCTIYRRRPRICREYPSPYGSFRPQVLPGCGFRIDEDN